MLLCRMSSLHQNIRSALHSPRMYGRMLKMKKNHENNRFFSEINSHLLEVMDFFIDTNEFLVENNDFFRKKWYASIGWLA